EGYGFIGPNDGVKDDFVHISAVERAGMTTLNEGQKIEYEIVAGQNGKSSAENLVAVD
ncbi:MAG: cold-shock protein, partial [Proteobacteria bacterium]|nr:cold-shock protein [Pseudomonadota bacterium]